MSYNDYLYTLILDIEKENYEQGIKDILEDISTFSRVGNIKEMDISYGMLREHTKKHKQFLVKLREGTNEENR